MLEKGGTVNIQDGNGETALHIAIKKGRGKMVLFLINKEADVNIQNIKKNTPLHTAVEMGDPKIVALLVKHGADPSIKNDDDKSPLELAEVKNNAEIVAILQNTSEELQKSDEELVEGYSGEREEEVDNPKSIQIPEQEKDPYTRYKDPQKVLNELNREVFEEGEYRDNKRISQISDCFSRNNHHNNSQRPRRLVSKAERSKKKWVRTNGEGVKEENRKNRLKEQNEEENKNPIELIEEAERLMQEQNEQNSKKSKKKGKGKEEKPKTQAKEEKPKAQAKEEKPAKKASKDSESKHSTTKKKNAEKSSKNINPTRKIKKDLKRIESSSSDESSEEMVDDNDDIVVLPSFDNNPSTTESKPVPISSLPTAEPENTQPIPSQSPPPQFLPSAPQPSVRTWENYPMNFNPPQQLHGYGAILVPQPFPQYFQQPFIQQYPPMMPQQIQPNMQQPMQYPPNTSNFTTQQPTVPGVMQPMANQPRIQKLNERISHLESILKPQLDQLNKQSVQNYHPPCFSCHNIISSSICPKCGQHFCQNCRESHSAYKCI